MKSKWMLSGLAFALVMGCSSAAETSVPQPASSSTEEPGPPPKPPAEDAPCVIDADCHDTTHTACQHESKCVEGVCEPHVVHDGSPCALPDDAGEGHCVDGVCSE